MAEETPSKIQAEVISHAIEGSFRKCRKSVEPYQNSLPACSRQGTCTWKAATYCCRNTWTPYGSSVEHERFFSWHVKILILDEADRLLNDDLEKSLDEILNVIPKTRQMYLFSVTLTKKDYIHRVGRTARAGQSGVAISLESRYVLEWYLLIEKVIGKKLPEFPADEEESSLCSLFKCLCNYWEMGGCRECKEANGIKQNKNEACFQLGNVERWGTYFGAKEDD